MKQSAHFEVTFPAYKWVVEKGEPVKKKICDLTVSGVAYKYDDDDEPYGYDVEYIESNGKIIPQEFLELTEFDPKEDEDYNREIMSHIITIFRDIVKMAA